MKHRTRIKICGLTREVDVDAAVDAGADAVGFVFYERSPRHVDVARAALLAQRLPPFVVPVGLFVNALASQVNAVLAALPHLVLQFHGDETPGECSRFGRPYLRAARMKPGFSLLDFCAAHPSAQALLLDADVEGFGGSGKVFDWSLVPPKLPHRLVLSGGLHAENVGEGIARVRPWAVDVSSGVETAQSGKGIKDAAAMRRFCEAVREADARPTPDQAFAGTQ
ncbi:MAG: phosphoribosylanthranilate isomerase [Burkholderiaceae bacterium]